MQISEVPPDAVVTRLPKLRYHERVGDAERPAAWLHRKYELDAGGLVTTPHNHGGTTATANHFRSYPGILWRKHGYDILTLLARSEDGEDSEEYPQSDDGEEGTLTLNGDTLDTSIVLSLCPR